jgi:hypothetical protein
MYTLTVVVLPNTTTCLVAEGLPVSVRLLSQEVQLPYSEYLPVAVGKILYCTSHRFYVQYQWRVQSLIAALLHSHIIGSTNTSRVGRATTAPRSVTKTTTTALVQVVSTTPNRSWASFLLFIHCSSY